jgi:hypothetical protein
MVDSSDSVGLHYCPARSAAARVLDGDDGIPILTPSTLAPRSDLTQVKARRRERRYE